MNAITRAEAFAPASMGNVGVGFDVLGLAFQQPGDRVCVERRDEPGAVIVAIEGDGGALPHDAAKNTATVAANAFLEKIDAPHGLGITLYKDLPLASGLGSSAASAVAAVIAANALFEEPLPREALLTCCLEGEAVVSGYHADNVAPALLGGIVLVMGVEVISRLPVPQGMHMALVTPQVAVPTIEARAVLPQTVSLKAMVAQTAAVARLVDALHRGDIAAVGAAMEQDGVIEPARAHLIPHLERVRSAAKQAGAFGVVISGAGPTLCAVCDAAETAQRVSSAMKDVYMGAGVPAHAHHTTVSREGAQVLSVL